MTPRERVLAVLHGKQPDKVPFTIYEKQLPRCTVERQLRNEGVCIVYRQQQPYKIERPNCPAMECRYVENGRPRIRRVIKTPLGDLSTVHEDAGYTEWFVERIFKDPADYARLRFMVEDECIVPCYDEYLAAERRMGEDVILRGAVGLTPLHEIMIHWMGAEVFAVEWAERRDEILRLYRLMADKHRERYRVLADSPITHANYGGNEVPEVMGPPRFKEFVVPLYDACAEFFRPRGKLLGAHLDGNNRAWAHLVARSSLDYVEAFTPAPEGDMTLEDALRNWPDKVIWIHFPSSLMLSGPDRVRAAAREFVALARQTNRVIIGITENYPEERWEENLLAISEVIDSE